MWHYTEDNGTSFCSLRSSCRKQAHVEKQHDPQSFFFFGRLTSDLHWKTTFFSTQLIQDITVQLYFLHPKQTPPLSACLLQELLELDSKKSWQTLAKNMTSSDSIRCPIVNCVLEWRFLLRTDIFFFSSFSPCVGNLPASTLLWLRWGVSADKRQFSHTDPQNRTCTLCCHGRSAFPCNNTKTDDWHKSFHTEMKSNDHIQGILLGFSYGRNL